MWIGLALSPSAGRAVPATTKDPATFVAASTATAAGTSCTPAPPAGIQSGDLLVACIALNDGGSASNLAGGTGGWTVRGSNVGTTGVAARVFSRVATGSEPATYTASDIDLVDSTGIRCTILAYRPAAGTTLTVEAGNPQANVSGTNQITPSITPTRNNAMLVVFGAAAAGRSWTAPTLMTERADAGVNMTIGGFDVVQTVAAAVTKTAVIDSAVVAVMAIVALTPS